MQIGKSVALLDANSTSIFPYTSANSIFYVTEVPKGSDGATEFSGTPLAPVTSSIIGEISDNSEPSYIQASSRNLNQWGDDISNLTVVTGLKVLPLTDDISVGENTVPKNQSIGIIGYKRVSGTAFLKNNIVDSSTVKKITSSSEEGASFCAVGLSDKTDGRDGSCGVFFTSPYSLSFTGNMISNSPLSNRGRRRISFLGVAPDIQTGSVVQSLSRLTVDFYNNNGSTYITNYIAYTKDIEQVDASVTSLKNSVATINSSISGINDRISDLSTRISVNENSIVSINGSINTINIQQGWQDASIAALRAGLGEISAVNDLYFTTDDSNVVLALAQPYTSSTGTVISGSDSEPIGVNLTTDTALVKCRLNPTLTIQNINCSRDISARSITCSSTLTSTNIFGTSVTVTDLSVNNAANVKNLNVESLNIKNGDRNKVVTGTGEAYPLRIIDSEANKNVTVSFNTSNNTLQADISTLIPKRESFLLINGESSQGQGTFTRNGSDTVQVRSYFTVNGAGVAILHIKIAWNRYSLGAAGRSWQQCIPNWQSVASNYMPIGVPSITLAGLTSKIMLCQWRQPHSGNENLYGVTLGFDVVSGKMAFVEDMKTQRLKPVDGWMHFEFTWIY